MVVDNASTDNTRSLLAEFSDRIEIVANEVNNGFAGGQNQAIRRTKTPWVLVFNPDVRAASGFLSRLLQAGEIDPLVGTVCGKLISMSPDFRTPAEKGEPAFVDSTGIYFTPELRHFDRGSGTGDLGQFERAEYVFGATGAAALYRREMIEDVTIDSEFFDEDFFAYREDADLSWRAQLLGWKCLYTPSAIAFHVRRVLPSNRSEAGTLVNMHSVKNRFLMRVKNVDGTLYRRYWFAITLRDLLVVAGCVLREHSSLPAFAFVLRHWRKTLAKRRVIMKRRRVPPAQIARWFASSPTSFPVTSVDQIGGDY